MDTQTLPITPFGKYKGKPVTELLADVEYLNWVKQQEWFKNYPTVYNICVNQTITNINQGSKTPEHNKLQNNFLERSFNITFINHILGLDNDIKLLNELYDNPEYKLYFENQRFNTNDYGLESITPIFEADFNWDVCLTFYGYNSHIEFLNQNPTQPYVNREQICSKLFKKFKYLDYRRPYKGINFPRICINHLCIEIKPLMGDDYPNVLRKMNVQIKLHMQELDKSHRLRGEFYHPSLYILLVDEYSSSVTSKEQLIEIFKQSNIIVVFISDLLGQNMKVKRKVKVIRIDEPTNNEIKNLKEENKLLQEKLLQSEEKIKQLEGEIVSLKSQKTTQKSIQDFMVKR